MKQYAIMQRGKVVNYIYGTYEEARSLVRQRIRVSVLKGRSVKKGLWDKVSRNPVSISAYGYKIVAI